MPQVRPGSPFSADLDCKPCVYHGFGTLNGKKATGDVVTGRY
jgi:hypothetical protein